jgi:phosphoribosylanthranilate isomerase
MRTRVKICCIGSPDEARMAIAAGADAVGLVGAMPSGPGPIPDSLIARIVPHVPPGVATFLLSCETTAEGLIAHARRTGVSTLQIVDRVEPTVYARVREALPPLKLVQVLHVEDESALEAAQDVATQVDAILLDSGRPGAAIKELGGTGRVHDWMVSRRIVEGVPVPVYLAGGLTARNVATAIELVRPFGVDVCSGVRTDGRLDPGKLEPFVAMVAGA